MAAADRLHAVRRGAGHARRVARGAVRGAATSAAAPQAFPPGNFYSPVPSAELLSDPAERDRVWPAEAADPPGIDVRSDAQLALLERLGRHPWPTDAGPRPAYDPGNDQFPPQDAALLRALLLELRPRRVVEVGCGWSTTVTGRAIADGGFACELTCIEPYPRDFVPSIEQVTTLRVERVELTPPSVFAALGAGDVLFVDSSHVAKTGSDVVHLVLEVLPRLADGVVVHVHDVFWPHDYPQGWVRAGFGWNEQYLLQAFLAGNARAHVLALSHWLAVRHPEAVAAALGPNLDGSSVWFTTGPAPLAL
ncbi:MAG TPA: class I SAM-dependent methyltransferase [Iamia sp.]|nr:class I SAM-dependent methyltransferase [Iamia sp.]